MPLLKSRRKDFFRSIKNVNFVGGVVALIGDLLGMIIKPFLRFF